MRDWLEQAGDARRTAHEIRRHLHDHEGYDFCLAAKHCERLDARAAELEWRWLTLPRPLREVRVRRWLWMK